MTSPYGGWIGSSQVTGVTSKIIPGSKSNGRYAANGMGASRRSQSGPPPPLPCHSLRFEPNSGNKVVISNVPASTGEITVMMVVKPDNTQSTSGYGGLVNRWFSPNASNMQWTGSIRTDGKLVWVVRPEVGEGYQYIDPGTNSIDDGNWHHVAFVYKSGTDGMQIYIDGVLDSYTTGVGTGIMNQTTPNIDFGLHNNDPAYTYAGYMQKGKIYNIAMTGPQVLEQYQNWCNQTELATDCIGWWPMNEGTGSTVFDISGEGNEGTISGASWSDTCSC